MLRPSPSHGTLRLHSDDDGLGTLSLGDRETEEGSRKQLSLKNS